MLPQLKSHYHRKRPYKNPEDSSAEEDSFSFDDWSQNANEDGWVCRSDVDCDWIDSNLGCDDREFSNSSIQVKQNEIVANIYKKRKYAKIIVYLGYKFCFQI